MLKCNQITSVINVIILYVNRTLANIMIHGNLMFKDNRMLFDNIMLFNNISLAASIISDKVMFPDNKSFDNMIIYDNILSNDSYIYLGKLSNVILFIIYSPRKMLSEKMSTI
jgi:hypothetical protein